MIQCDLHIINDALVVYENNLHLAKYNLMLDCGLNLVLSQKKNAELVAHSQMSH